MAGNSTEPGRSVTSKIAAILMSFTNGRGHALGDLARQAGLPTSTAHRLARELTDRHLLERTDDGEFRVGLPLRTYTQATITNPEQLHRALQCVRLHGMATSCGELQAGRYGVAVPVLCGSGTAIAAVGIDLPDLEQATLGRVVPALVLASRGLARELAVDARDG